MVVRPTKEKRNKDRKKNSMFFNYFIQNMGSPRWVRTYVKEKGLYTDNVKNSPHEQKLNYIILVLKY